MNVEILEDKIFYYKNIINNPDQLINFIENTDYILDKRSILSKWNDWIAYQSDYSFGMQKKFIANFNQDIIKINIL
jgi:hypothetical protein